MKPERFWSKVDADGDCWEWMASRNQGYGVFRIAGRGYRAHRVAYELLVGPIPEGLQIDHLCRNHGCVNPDHLEVVTNAENIRRGEGPTARNARKTHCKRGHELTPENTYIGRDRSSRECRICRAIGHNTGAPPKWHGLKKLTDADVMEIHSLAASGVSRAETARRFGIDPGHVSNIVNGKRRS